MEKAPETGCGGFIGRGTWVLLVGISALAFLVRFCAGLKYPNIIWPDEIFQSIEQAHRLAFGNGVVPWEWKNGLRSWLFPGFLAGVMKVTGWMGAGSGGYMAAVTLVLCALSAAIVPAVFLWERRRVSIEGAAIAAAICVVWFELIYFAPKALGEVAGTHLMVVGVILADMGLDDGNRRRICAGSVLLGLAACLRMQLAPAILLALAWLSIKEIYRCSKRPGRVGVMYYMAAPARLFAWAAIPVILAGAVDWATWSFPFQSFIKNYEANIKEGVSDMYGSSAGDAYMIAFRKVWGWWAPAAVFFILLGAANRPLMLAMALAILGLHSRIGHKEYRFVYPVIVMGLVLASCGAAELVNLVRGKTGRRSAAIGTAAALAAIWTAASITLSAGYTKDKTGISQFDPLGPRISNWKRLGGAIRAFDETGADASACGVALQGIDLFATGGYSHLHRDIPLFFDKGRDYFDEKRPFFNRVLGLCKNRLPAGFRLLRKFDDGICLLGSDKGCEPAVGYHINLLVY
jgi:hypothetical protein